MKTPAMLVCFAACAALGQQAPEPVFKSTTKLVQVSVIAQDKDGKPVADLRREDFQIFDNGAPQELRLFLSQKSDPTPVKQEAPGTFTNRMVPSSDADSGSRGGYSVLLFDNNALTFEYVAGARLKALDALRAIPALDKVAMYSLWCKFRVIREFTSDRDSLLEQLDTFKAAPGGCGSGGGDDPPGSLANPALAMPSAPGHAAGEPERIGALQRLSISDDEIQAMTDHLAGVPGRKNLIWIGNGFQLGPMALRKLINAGVAVYPVGAVGGIALESEKNAKMSWPRRLAAMTGGIAFYDLDGAIRTALEDGRVSYILGFYETGGDSKPGDVGKPAAHQLGVRVSRPGVTLRYRTSYEAEPDVPLAPSGKPDPMADFVQAMDRPVDATAIGITASATRIEDRLDLAAKFDLSGLDLALDQGLWKGQVEVVARFMTAQATQAGDAMAETMTLKLRPETYQAYLKDGLPYKKELSIPAKAVEVKLLIGNLASGKIGTLTIPLSQFR